MESQLVMFRDSEPGREFPLRKEVVIIGRREDCDLRIALAEISRKHCRLIHGDNAGWVVEDMGSSNGTFVNGKRVQSIELEPGDTLQVGPVVFVLQVDGEPPADQMSPVVHPKEESIGDMIKLDDSGASSE